MLVDADFRKRCEEIEALSARDEEIRLRIVSRLDDLERLLKPLDGTADPDAIWLMMTILGDQIAKSDVNISIRQKEIRNLIGVVGQLMEIVGKLGGSLPTIDDDPWGLGLPTSFGVDEEDEVD